MSGNFDWRNMIRGALYTICLYGQFSGGEALDCQRQDEYNTSYLFGVSFCSFTGNSKSGDTFNWTFNEDPIGKCASYGCSSGCNVKCISYRSGKYELSFGRCGQKCFAFGLKNPVGVADMGEYYVSFKPDNRSLVLNITSVPTCPDSASLLGRSHRCSPPNELGTNMAVTTKVNTSKQLSSNDELTVHYDDIAFICLAVISLSTVLCIFGMLWVWICQRYSTCGKKTDRICCGRKTYLLKDRTSTPETTSVSVSPQSISPGNDTQQSREQPYANLRQNETHLGPPTACHYDTRLSGLACNKHDSMKEYGYFIPLNEGGVPGDEDGQVMINTPDMKDVRCNGVTAYDRIPSYYQINPDKQSSSTLAIPRAVEDSSSAKTNHAPMMLLSPAGHPMADMKYYEGQQLDWLVRNGLITLSRGIDNTVNVYPIRRTCSADML